MRKVPAAPLHLLGLQWAISRTGLLGALIMPGNEASKNVGEVSSPKISVSGTKRTLSYWGMIPEC